MGSAQMEPGSSRTGALPDRPRTLRVTSWLLVVLVGLLAASAVLARAMRDDLVLAWAGGDDTAGPLVASGGLDALEESAIAVPAFPILAVVMFVVFGMLLGVLQVFVRQGYAWARAALSLAVVFVGCVAAFALGASPPPVFAAVLAVSLAVDAAVLVLLWHRDTTAFLWRRARLV